MHDLTLINGRLTFSEMGCFVKNLTELSACLVGVMERKGKKKRIQNVLILLFGWSINYVFQTPIQLSDEILIPSKIEWKQLHSNSSKTYP